MSERLSILVKENFPQKRRPVGDVGIKRTKVKMNIVFSRRRGAQFQACALKKLQVESLGTRWSISCVAVLS